MYVQIFAIVLGIIILLAGISSQKKRSAKLNSGKFKEITGRVTSFTEKVSRDYDGETHRHYTSISYYPLYEYEVDGKSYTYEGKVGSSRKGGLGKTMTFLYNYVFTIKINHTCDLFFCYKSF